MGGTKMQTVDMSLPAEAAEESKAKAVKKTRVNQRSKKYRSVKSYVDRTKFYPVAKAVELLQKTSYSSFPGSVTVDAVLKDQNLNVETSFPYSTGKQVRVAIATEELLKDIEAGRIEFDVLLSEPKMMAKLAKHARVLGPRGLMPNPKNKTVTDNPEARQKELQKGITTIRTEKKAPLLHITIGKTNMKAEELAANLEHLIKVVGPRKILKLTISATMSPGIKVDLSEYQAA